MGDIRALLIAAMVLSLTSSCATIDSGARLKRARAKEALGNSLILEGRLEAGLKELLEAATLDPTNPHIQNSIGLAYRDLGKYQEAIIHFKKALELKPNFPETDNNLGTVYLLLKDWEKAIECFRRAAENIYYPTPYIAYTNLGTVYHVKGDFQKAIRYYQKAIRHLRAYGPAHDNLGLAYQALRRWDDAEEAFKQAIKCAPEAPKPRLHLARLYLSLGLKKEAKKELLQVVKLDKDGPYGREAGKLLMELTEKR